MITWNSQLVNERIILKMILKKQDMNLWVGFNWIGVHDSVYWKDGNI